MEQFGEDQIHFFGKSKVWPTLRLCTRDALRPIPAKLGQWSCEGRCLLNGLLWALLPTIPTSFLHVATDVGYGHAHETTWFHRVLFAFLLEVTRALCVSRSDSPGSYDVSSLMFVGILLIPLSWCLQPSVVGVPTTISLDFFASKFHP